MSNGKPSSAPAGLQQVEVPMNPMRANRMAWAAFALGVVAIVANSLTGAGFVPKLAMQVCGWLAGLCTALSWYLARKTPSFESMKAAKQNGNKEGSDADSETGGESRSDPG